jgi:hypothetical protein
MTALFLQPEKIDVAWVRRLALNFEKRISKNAELRAKFENDPQKFVSTNIHPGQSRCSNMSKIGSWPPKPIWIPT